MEWKNKKVALALCNNQDYVLSDFFWNFSAILKPDNWRAFRGIATIKSQSLNDVTKAAMDWGAEYILYMDIDMMFPIDIIPQLLSNDEPVVSGQYHLKYTPYSIVAGWNAYNVLVENGILNVKRKYINSSGDFFKDSYYPLDNPNGKIKLEKKNNNLIGVDWVGFGCILVKREVIEKIGVNCFEDKWDYKLGSRAVGHDILFCDKVKKAGYKVWIDKNVQCGHMENRIVNSISVDSYYNSDIDKKEEETVKKQAKSESYWNKIWREEPLGWVNRTNLIPEYTDIVNLVDKGSKVLELGSACGALLNRLIKEKNCDVEGWDFSLGAIEGLRSQGMKAKKVDFESINQEIVNENKDKYDYVLLVHTLEHIKNDEGFLKAAIEMAKHGGYIILLTPTVNLSQTAAAEHERIYSEEDLRGLIEKAGKDNIEEAKIEVKEGVKESKVLFSTIKRR